MKSALAPCLLFIVTGERMFVGVIRAKSIFLHPVTVASMIGWKGFLKMVIMSLSLKQYTFLETLQESSTASTPEKIRVRRRKSPRPPMVPKP